MKLAIRKKKTSVTFKSLFRLLVRTNPPQQIKNKLYRQKNKKKTGRESVRENPLIFPILLTLMREVVIKLEDRAN